MRICVLASGSTGNATIIEVENQAILIDSGLSYKKLQELIKRTEFDENKLTHILITHEHADHVKGVGVVTRKLGLTVCSTAPTIEAMISKKIIKQGVEKTQALTKYESAVLGAFEVIPFHISHDAVDPVGYKIIHKEKVLVYLTDLGFVTQDMINGLKNADTYIMEVNHNVEMLHMSNRPWSLKQRILSDCGHLSNEDSAYALAQLIGERTKHVYMAHLSQEANMPDLAHMTLKHILKECSVDLNAISLHMTYATEPATIVTL